MTIQPVAAFALALSVALSALPVQAQERTTLEAAVTAVVEVARLRSENPETIVLAPAVGSLGEVMVFGRPAVVLSEAQARDQQRAWFIRLSSITYTADGVEIVYSTPATGYSGRALVAWTNGAWTVVSNQREHSSSGRRAFFGRFYEGVPCRDGTEMAERWSSNVELVRYIQTYRTLPKALPPGSGKCPGREFPEVEAYRQMKR